MFRAIRPHDLKIEVVDQGWQARVIARRVARRVGPTKSRHDRGDSIPEKFARTAGLSGGDHTLLDPGLQRVIRVGPNLLRRGECIDKAPTVAVIRTDRPEVVGGMDEESPQGARTHRLAGKAAAVFLHEESRRTGGVGTRHARAARPGIPVRPLGDGREQGVPVGDEIRLDAAVIDRAGRGELVQLCRGEAARPARFRVKDRSHRDEVLRNSEMPDGLVTAAMLSVAARVERGIIVHDTASEGIQRHGVARRRIVNALVAGAPEHQKIGGSMGDRVAGLGGFVIATKGGFGSRRATPGSPPFPIPGGSARSTHPDPALEIAVTVVREKNHPGLRRGGGSAGDQFEGIIIPVVAVDPRGRSHAKRRRVKSGRRNRPGDVGRMIVGCGSVPNRHTRIGCEFLMRREHGAAIPDTDRRARAGKEKGSECEPIGPG